jgi:hypothetical protein
LEPELRSVVPACRLVSDRLLRRVLHELIDAGRPVVANTRLPWWVTRADLDDVDDVESNVLTGTDDPLLLLVGPEDRADLPVENGDIRAEFARLLLQSEVYRRVLAAVESGNLTAHSVEPYFRAANWDYEPDARFVLTTDHLVPFDAVWATFFPRFVAATWVLVETEPHALASIHPACPSPAAARAALGAVFDTSHLPTAPPVRPIPPELPEPAPHVDRAGVATFAARSARTGNHIRAAIFWTLAGEAGKAASDVRDGFMGLLAPALKLDPPTAARWVDAVLPLLGPAGQGNWPHAALALYDLQTLGLDLRGELFAVDSARWVKSFGRKSVKRPLTRAIPVLRYRALASARRHIEKAHLPASTAGPVLQLIDDALHAAEAEARAEYVPRVTTALDAVGLWPTTVVERVAVDKLANELVDKACDRGYLRFGDLRDAIARNNVKLPDLRGPGEFVRGDPLLRADKLLVESLSGVYHGGEAYLRGIQRVSSLAFGTLPGRLLSKYVALPFGGAFLALEFVQHMVHAGQGAYRFASKILAPKPAATPTPDSPPAMEWEWSDEFNDFVQVQIDRSEAVQVAKVVFTSSHAGPHLVTGPSVVGFGLFLLALLYWPAFRAAVFRAARLVWSVVRFIFHDLPLAAWQSEPVRAVRRHRVTRYLTRRFGSAVLVGGTVALVLSFFGASPGRIARGAGLWFALVALGRMLPAGRAVEDRVAQLLADGWRVVRVNLIPGLVGWVVWAFRELAARVERALYAVDEWFRFREGQSKPSYTLKVILGCVWFPIAYVVRFAFNLLIEPQVNPVKHFPVVTVSHKVLFTSLIPVSNATGISEATLGVIFTGIPGVFGFLAWEGRENWRLYAANRPRGLTPDVLGHHGETMRGLLRPGFHSGTVPKQFKAIRRQLAKPPGDRKESAVAKAEQELHHLEPAICRFVEREFLPLLSSAKAWQGVDLRAGHVRLTPTAAVVEVLAGTNGVGPVVVTFRNHDGVFVANVDRDAIIAVGACRAETLAAAVNGFMSLGAAVPPPELGPVWTWDDWAAYWEKATISR